MSSRPAARPDELAGLSSHALRTRSLRRLYDRHCEAHLRDVLTLILETGNDSARRRDHLRRLGPAPDACGLVGAHASAWLDAFDRVDLVALYGQLHANRKAAPLAPAIATVPFRALPADGRPNAAPEWARRTVMLKAGSAPVG